MKTTSERFSCLFQILVVLDTISDWPWWVSGQHFHSWGMPTRVPTGNTMLLVNTPLRPATPLTTMEFFMPSIVALQRIGACRKMFWHRWFMSRHKSAPLLLSWCAVACVTETPIFPLFHNFDETYKLMTYNYKKGCIFSQYLIPLCYIEVKACLNMSFKYSAVRDISCTYLPSTLAELLTS
jgi:hypothetical protein